MRRPKILVCDDDPMIVQVVVSKLMSEGYDVGSSAGGRELLRKMQGEVPDLVIIDAMMPGIDGASIVDAIRNAPRFKDLPIMMLSAKRDPDFVGRMVRAGITDYLSKPFALGDLTQRVKKFSGKADRVRYVQTLPLWGGERAALRIPTPKGDLLIELQLTQ